VGLRVSHCALQASHRLSIAARMALNGDTALRFRPGEVLHPAGVTKAFDRWSKFLCRTIRDRSAVLQRVDA